MKSLSVEGTYVLPKILDSSFAPQLYKDINALRGQNVEISGENVERVSTPCLQVLLSAAMTWNIEGRSFEITQASDIIVDAVSMLGMDGIANWGDVRP